MIGLKGIKVVSPSGGEAVIIRTCVVGDSCHAVLMDTETGVLCELPVTGLTVVEGDRVTCVGRVRVEGQEPVAELEEDGFRVPIAGGPPAIS